MAERVREQEARWRSSERMTNWKGREEEEEMEGVEELEAEGLEGVDEGLEGAGVEAAGLGEVEAGREFWREARVWDSPVLKAARVQWM
jgi:hypothetical protein